ncbi:MAG: hypothetical protein K9I85_09650 [Saprospiraceae bacterium]|nr:hypothetical protein [Saprospiraceae bacterium]
MKNYLFFWLIMIMLSGGACRTDQKDVLVSVNEDRLQFEKGEDYPLSLSDTSTTIVFLASYLPTFDPEALTRQASSLERLFRQAPLDGLHVLNRPSAYDLVQPLADQHSLQLESFSFQEGAEVLDRLLLEEKGHPQLIVSSVTSRAAMISARIEPDWREEGEYITAQLVVIIHHPQAGIQLMKFPY